MPKKAPETEVRTLLPGEAVADQILLNQVVLEMTSLHLKMGLAYHLALGNLLLTHFFEGDAEKFAKRGKKHTSFRALAARDDLPVKVSTIYNAVKVTRQYKNLPEEHASKLAMVHHRALLPLKDEKSRKKLAARAVKDKLTGVELRNAVANEVAKAQKGEKRGRKVMPGFEKTLNMFGRILKKESAFADLDGIADMNQERRDELFSTLSGIKLKCQELQDALNVKG